MNIIAVEGHLLFQLTDAIVHPWNRNIIPWWLLVLHGVSGSIRRYGGDEPFRDLGRKGALAPGSAVSTTAGRLPYRAIIHVACTGLVGTRSRAMVQDSTRHAVQLAEHLNVRSLAMPVLAPGMWGHGQVATERRMREVLDAMREDMTVVIVRRTL
jgi:O-acetyl-ADP-ribose deacetylase (regulator of RNase III)